MDELRKSKEEHRNSKVIVDDPEMGVLVLSQRLKYPRDFLNGDLPVK